MIEFKKYDSATYIAEPEGFIFSITADNSPKPYYTVTGRKLTEKGKTLATRCSFENAVKIANEFYSKLSNE